MQSQHADEGTQARLRQLDLTLPLLETLPSARHYAPRRCKSCKTKAESYAMQLRVSFKKGEKKKVSLMTVFIL